MKKNMLNIRLAVVFLIATVSLNAQSIDLDNYRWTTLETAGDAKGRHENAFIEFRGKFYLIGGRGINPVNCFDPKTNTWETKGNTPFEIHHFQAAVDGDVIYIAGGMTGKYPKEKPLENIWMYYPKKDEWVKGAEIPVNRRRGSSGTVIYKGKLYLVCGINYGHTSGTNNYFDSYDLKTGTWETLTKAPNIRDHFSAIVVDDKLYCIGGRNTSIHHEDNFGAFFNATIPLVDVYDFTTKKWVTLKNELPIPTAAGGIVHINDCIVYMGGEGSQKQAFNNTQCLDLRTGKWKQLTPLNIGRHGSNAILYNNSIYIAAGSQVLGGGNMNSIEVFSEIHNWQQLFNGKNLDGWKIKCTSQDKNKNFWTVENGVIVCNSLGSTEHNYIWLQSEKEYANFELRLKFQITRKTHGNSGVQIRSRYHETAEVEDGIIGWLDGPQVDIDPKEPWRTGLIYDETREMRQWINPLLPDWKISKSDIPEKKVISYYEDEASGWNDLTIICKEMQIKTLLNNIVISNYNGSGILDSSNHKRHNVGNKGHIALQLHKNSENLIQFKDIEIRVFE